MELRPLVVETAIDDARWHHIPSIAATIEHICRQTLDHVGFPYTECPTEVFIQCTNDAYIHQLNKEHRNKDKPTNVLSFPGEELEAGNYGHLEQPLIALGDIVIAYETVEREAAEANISLTHHFHHMVIHGLLHLLGHDHIDDSEAEAMEALEVEILSLYEIKNPY